MRLHFSDCMVVIIHNACEYKHIFQGITKWQTEWPPLKVARPFHLVWGYNLLSVSNQPNCQLRSCHHKTREGVFNFWLTEFPTTVSQCLCESKSAPESNFSIQFGTCNSEGCCITSSQDCKNGRETSSRWPAFKSPMMNTLSSSVFFQITDVVTECPGLPLYLCQRQCKQQWWWSQKLPLG